ncbi:MAG TPA: hypothetical protein VKX45_18160 [Bryobacteraceae bacterium]|jgi:hypothetical protein|nr:hypothetical protein [Bryobacteraceae bacterium]
MGVTFLPQDERERLELELLTRVRAARDVYLAASNNCSRIREQFLGMLDHPDGAFALHEAARKERIAMQAYARVLEEFAKVALNDRPQSSATGA